MTQKRKRTNPPSQPPAIPSSYNTQAPPQLARPPTRQTPILPPPIPVPTSSPPHQPSSTPNSAVNNSQTPSNSIAPKKETPIPPPVVPASPPQQRSHAKHRPVTPPNLKQAKGRLPISTSPIPPPPVPQLYSNGPTPAGSSKQGKQKPKNTSKSTEYHNQTMGSLAMPPTGLVPPEITYHIPHAVQSSHPTSLVRPHGPSSQYSRPGNAASLLPTTITPILPPKPPAMTSSSAAARPVSDLIPQRSDRNIDKVVLGKLCFRTWYPSYYGKELLGDVPMTNPKGGSKEGTIESGKTAKKEKDQHPMLERLYVCPTCFKYSKELVPWWGHVRLCEQKATVPGRKIYVHPRGRRKVAVPQQNNGGPAAKKRRGEHASRPVEVMVEDEGEWSIWEVDGEKDGLFCQNLSLFAKLFLDNKSVFFDVTGFNYFLLVYTPPANPDSGVTVVATSTPVPQVTGFFSKEKMSWDNNNLACILVFPPWQRKSLGSILMGASYEISRREGILGGPEKPISALGRKGYTRFWASEIARWLLSLPVTREDGSGTIVDLDDCSQATWISPDDCLYILRDMNIVHDAGIGPGKPEPVSLTEGDEKNLGTVEEGGPATEEATEPKPVPQVPRVKLDKNSVRRYIAKNRLSLEKTCDPAGFAEGYAMKRMSEDIEEEETDE